MINAVRSEWIKLRTIRMNWVLVIIAIAFPMIVSILTAALNDDSGFDAEDLLGVVQGTSVVTGMLLGVIGAATVTGEFGFGTIRPTFAATPKRLVVIVAKAFVTIVVAVAVEAAVVLGTFFIAGGIAEGRDRTIDLADAPNGKPAIVGIVAFAAIIGLLGFGLGLLIRNTPATVAILVLWPLVAEGIIGALLNVAGVEHPFKFLPYNAGISMANPESNPDTAEQLSRVAAGLYFFGVTAVVTALGALSTTKRDA